MSAHAWTLLDLQISAKLHLPFKTQLRGAVLLPCLLYTSQNLASASALRCAFHPGSSFAFHGRLTIHGIPISDILHSASAPHFQSTPKTCPLRHSDITATSCVPSRCQASLLTPSPAPGSYADQPVSWVPEGCLLFFIFPAFCRLHGDHLGPGKKKKKRLTFYIYSDTFQILHHVHGLSSHKK